MKFEFSIRKALKESWNLFKITPWFFVGLTIITVVINLAGGDKAPWYMDLISAIASIIMSYVWISIGLATVDGKNELLTVKKFSTHLPTLRTFFVFLGLWFVSGLFTLLGFIALIIPGIYIMIRLMFAHTAYVDRKGTIMQSMRYSWHMVRGDVFWTVFLTGLVSLGLLLLGIIMLGVGFLVLYPVSVFLVTKLYRTLSLHHDEQAVVVQPIEIVAPEKDVL